MLFERRPVPLATNRDRTLGLIPVALAILSAFRYDYSPHQLGLLEILEVSKMRDAAPEHVEFYTVIPKELEESIELSEVVENRKVEVAEMILARLADLGVEVTRK